MLKTMVDEKALVKIIESKDEDDFQIKLEAHLKKYHINAESKRVKMKCYGQTLLHIAVQSLPKNASSALISLRVGMIVKLLGKYHACPLYPNSEGKHPFQYLSDAPTDLQKHFSANVIQVWMQQYEDQEKAQQSLTLKERQGRVKCANELIEQLSLKRKFFANSYRDNYSGFQPYVRLDMSVKNIIRLIDVYAYTGFHLKALESTFRLLLDEVGIDLFIRKCNEQQSDLLKAPDALYSTVKEIFAQLALIRGVLFPKVIEVVGELKKKSSAAVTMVAQEASLPAEALKKTVPQIAVDPIAVAALQVLKDPLPKPVDENRSRELIESKVKQVKERLMLEPQAVEEDELVIIDPSEVESLAQPSSLLARLSSFSTEFFKRPLSVISQSKSFPEKVVQTTDTDIISAKVLAKVPAKVAIGKFSERELENWFSILPPDAQEVTLSAPVCEESINDLTTNTPTMRKFG